MKIRSLLVAALAVGPFLFALTATRAPKAEAAETSLKDRQQWAEMTKEIEARASAASKACDTKIEARFDIESFKGTDPFRESPTAACRDVLYNVQNLCVSAAGKDAVKQSVATVTCKKSTDGTRVTRSGKALTVSIDRQHSSITGKEKGSYSWKSALEEIL